MRKISRKDFIKTGSLGVLATAFGFSKLSNLSSVEAAVLDNSKSADISDDIIYTHTDPKPTDVFTSGQSAKHLAESVNELSRQIDEKTQELNNSFLSALTSLKDTAVAKAIKAVGSTFQSVIELIASVNVYTNVGTEDYATSTGNIVITDVAGADIPDGLYVSSIDNDGSNSCHIDVDKKSLLSINNLRNAGVRTVTDNGIYSTLKDDESSYESFEVNIDENSEGIGNSIYNKGYDKGTSDVFEAAQEKRVTASTNVQTIAPDENKLLKDVVIEPQKHSQQYNLSSNGMIDLGQVHNYRYINANIAAGADEIAIAYCRHHSNNANFVYSAQQFIPRWSHATPVDGYYLRAYDDYSNSSVSRLQITILRDGWYYDSMSGQKRWLGAGTVIQRNVTTHYSEEYVLVAHYAA